jgi:hypothetical protein
MKTFLLITLWFFVLSLAIFCQSKLSNSDVIDMIQAGLPEKTILLSIQKSRDNFDTSPKALIALKKAGATEKILDAIVSKDQPKQSQSLTEPTASTSDTEIVINAPVDKVRTTLLLHFTRQKFNLDRDNPNHLVFSKKAGGLSGNVAGVLFGKDMRNPRLIYTFLILASGKGTLVTGKFSYLYPDRQGEGTVKDRDTSSTRKEIAKELAKVKAEAEKG